LSQEYAVDPEDPAGPTAHLQATTQARERPVHWLELFYDLVFAAAVVTFSHSISESPSPVQNVVEVIAFDGVWMMWVATTLHANTFGVDDAVHRGLVLVQMLLLTVVAIAVGDGLRAEPQIVGGAFALLTIDVAVMYARQAKVPGSPGALAVRRRNQFAVATVPLLAGLALSGWPRDVLWFASLGIIAVSTFGFRFGRVARAVHLDIPHLVERLGLLTIIMCGEAFVKVSLVAADGHLDGIDAVILVSLFVVIFSIWWAYFDDIPNAGLRDDAPHAGLWLLGHLGFHLGLVGVAVGYGQWLRIDLHETLSGERSLLATTPFVELLLALALIGFCTYRVPRGGLLALRLGSAVTLAALAVLEWRAEWSNLETAAGVLACLALIFGGVSAHLRTKTRVPEGMHVP
jgi:low temperature requirement protein LtrA